MQQRHLFNTLPLRTAITSFSQHKKTEKKESIKVEEKQYLSVGDQLTRSLENTFSEEFIGNCFITLFCHNLTAEFDKKISMISQNESKFKLPGTFTNIAQNLN